jgi:hypothetical protein
VLIFPQRYDDPTRNSLSCVAVSPGPRRIQFEYVEVVDPAPIDTLLAPVPAFEDPIRTFEFPFPDVLSPIATVFEELIAPAPA